MCIFIYTLDNHIRKHFISCVVNIVVTFRGSHSVVTLRIGACDCDEVDAATSLGFNTRAASCEGSNIWQNLLVHVGITIMNHPFFDWFISTIYADIADLGEGSVLLYPHHSWWTNFIKF